jgi:hypothetical protein
MTSTLPGPAGHPAHPLFAAAALHSVASGTARPLAEALEMCLPRLAEAEAVRVASAALGSQELAPLFASLPDLAILPPSLREQLRREMEEGRRRAASFAFALAESVGRLREAECEVVAVGEAAAAITVYRSPELRPVRTVRLLLVRKADSRRAGRSLPPRTDVSVLARLAFRVFGPAVDLTELTLDEPVVRTVEGTRVLVPSPAALAAQLLFTAAAGFAGDGMPGALAIDLRLLSLSVGPLSLGESVPSRPGAASLIHAVDAVERFCPGTFAPAFVSRLAGGVPARQREIGRGIPPLRHTRPPGGGPLPVALLGSRLGRIPFFLRPPGLVG